MSQHQQLAPPAAGEHPRTSALGECVGRVDRRHVGHVGLVDGMVIAVDGARDRAWVRLIGDLDLASGPHVRWGLPRLGCATLVVDLSRLAFIDAAGLSSLLLVRRQFEQTGRCLHLYGATGSVRRVFELSRLGHLLEDVG